MWHKAYQYLQKIGSVVLVASIIIWGLGYYPKNSSILSSSQKTETIQKSTNTIGINDSKSLNPAGDSYLEKIGIFIEPVIKPLGFDWKMGVSLLAGVAAKEVVVSTMGVIYGQTDTGIGLGEKLKLQEYTDGSKVYTPMAALSFLVFILIYFPCIAVVVAVAKESGKAIYALFLVVYTSLLAWTLSFAVYQIGQLLLN